MDELEQIRQICLGVRDWGKSLASQEFDDDSLEGIEPAVAVKAIQSLIAAAKIEFAEELKTAIERRIKEEGDDGCYRVIVGDIQSAIKPQGEAKQGDGA